MENNDINKNTVAFLEYKDNSIFLDLKDILANHATRLLLGGGIEFTSDEKKIVNFWNKFKKWNNLEQMLNTLVYTLSQNGRQIITINKIKDKIILLFASPGFTNKIGKSYIQDELAVVWVQPIKDDKNIRIREEWDKEKVVRFGYNKDASITIDSVNKKLPKDEQIKQVEYHGMGFLPIVEFLNKNLDVFQLSNQSSTNDQSFQIISDDWPVQNVRRLIDVGLRTQTDEVAFNISRVIGTLDRSKVASLKKKGKSVWGYIYGKAILDIAQYGEKGGTPNLVYTPATPTLEGFMNGNKKVMEFYFENAGYSSPEQASMDTATQVLYAKSRDVETTNQKRQIITPKLLEMIDKVLYAAGIIDVLPENDDDRKYSFSIKNNLQISKSEQINNIGEQIRMGLMTKAEAIAELRGIDKDEAENVAKAIEEADTNRLNTLAGIQQQLAQNVSQNQNEEVDNGNTDERTEDNTEASGK